jgi:site-specific DNA recombinase
MRGKKAKAMLGQMAGGGFHRLYGYDYIKVADNNGGRRVINENEAKWVRQIYQWLVNDGLSTTAITYRLRGLNAPTKEGGLWCRAAVLNILKNPAYTGKTYAFTTINHKQYSKNRDEWIEIPDVTPVIIPQELFEVAQRQLQINRAKAKRNMKRDYLLRGHIHCRRCGRAYYGGVTNDRIGSQHKLVRRYRCSGKLKMVVPVNRCGNKSWQADKLEALVWKQIEHVLNNPELIITEIEKQRQGTNQLSVLGDELKQVERQLKALARGPLKDFPRKP